MSTLSEQKQTLITKLEALPAEVWEDADTGPFLTRTVNSLYADIAAMVPRNHCNMHSDCAAANLAHPKGRAVHCSSDDCEDCFGS